MNRGTRVVVVAILAAFVPFLDGAVVNVALPAIRDDLGGGLTTQQWVVDGYLLTLGSLILLSGSLADAYGRVRIMRIGLIAFGLASIACAIAPTAGVLIAARLAQGAAGALLVPSALALIVQEFRGVAQAAAIGTWTAWTSGAMIAGPVLGGVLVDLQDWRAVFWINVLPLAVTIWLLRGLGVEERPCAPRLDAAGAALAAIGLGGSVLALIEVPRLGWAHPLVLVSAVVGVGCLVAFAWWETRARNPMVPPSLLRIRSVAWGNLATLAIYGALSLGSFGLTVFVQETAGYTATQAGLASLPPTLLLLFLAPRVGRLAGRYGPRLFMTVGPLVSAVGYLLLLRATDDAPYWSELFPGIVTFGLGLALTVSPLTSAILGAVPPENAGIGSAVNNAVARIAGLVSVAMIGLIATQLDTAGFHAVSIACAVLFAIGGLLSWVGIRNPQPEPATLDSAQAD